MTKVKKQLNPLESPSLKNWGKPLQGKEYQIEDKDVVIDCGWGRLIFAHTFSTNTDIANVMSDEEEGRRDLAIYLRDPHVVLAKAPHRLFLDPSHTYRLWLSNKPSNCKSNHSFSIKEITTKEEVKAVNSIYKNRGMIPLNEDIALDHEDALTYLVAVDMKTNEVIGTMMGVDHKKAFSDPENGASLWALAVDSQATHSGVGAAIVQYFAEYYRKKYRSFIDVSVLHSNEQAIALYEKLNFERVPVFCIKNKNAFNETLYIAPEHNEKLNPYADIIIKEARIRGIEVDILDTKSGFFKLKHGGRSIVCRESLTELTTAIAMTRCIEKDLTNRLLKKEGLYVPEQTIASNKENNRKFLDKYKKIVVKPANNEQGVGITLPVTDYKTLEKAITNASGVGNADKVVLEEMVAGQDLRIIVINFKVVAAAVRHPPEIAGDSIHTVSELIQKLSRRREAATSGESSIPLDDETKRCIKLAGHYLEDIPEEGEVFQVRNTANLHTGGTIHDVTSLLHPTLIVAAERAAKVLDIPVVGFDFMVPSVGQSEYKIIEANERPGLANHDPQPTAERFIDLLFPNTANIS